MFCNQPFSHFPSQKEFPPTLEYFNAIRTQTQFDMILTNTPILEQLFK